jgi:hypothetical protein
LYDRQNGQYSRTTRIFGYTETQDSHGATWLVITTATLEGLPGWQDIQNFRTTENPGWQNKPGGQGCQYGKIARMLVEDNQNGRPARMTG